MQLTHIEKTNLLTSANQVYLGYTALDFFKSKTFNTDLGQSNFYDLCTSAIAKKQYDQTLVINNVHYRLLLIPGDNNTFKVQFARSIGKTPESVVKKIAEYDDQEALNLISNQELTIEFPTSGEKPSVSNRINEGYSIGGIGKVDLYRTHLVTLHNIIEKIESEEDISNLLVALATGSGKTFVQALWMLILSISKNNGVFAIPDKLVNQFTKDLKRLLPDEFVNNLLVLRNKEANPKAIEAIQSMAQEIGTGTIVIGSAERLLDQHYQELMAANSEHTFLSFDEQHLIMKAERRRVRLIELSKQKLSMFLTATPNIETYNLSGNKPVAIMSSGQKQEAGQGQFPKLFTHQAQNITDRNRLRNYRFWTIDFWSNMLNGLLLRVINSIQQEHSSAASSLVDDLPFYMHRKTGEPTARWGMQVPAARKMLCIIDDNETLVNFCYSLNNGYSPRRDIYNNGNLVNRGDVANFFGLPDAEEVVLRKNMQDKKEDYRASFTGGEFGIGYALSNKTLANHLKDTVFHNLIEYVLTDITGLDEIEHNRLRKEHMEDFMRLIRDKFTLRTAAYYEKKLAKEIDPDGARDIGELLSCLSSFLESMISGSFDRVQVHTNQALQLFIDNWNLSDEIIIKLKTRDYRFSNKFNSYVQNHLMVGVMSGMKDSETSVEESRPFSGLDRNSYPMYDGNGSLVSHAKKRKHTSLEILNDTSNESTFTPTYLNVSEEIADNYFRLGFVGAYVSNKKTEGFSDRNLHTVVNISEKKLSPTNSPETQIQGIGRNRGLDDTIEPAYIHSLGRGQKTVFDLNNLQSNDYYPALFKSQKQFNKEYIEVLGQTVSQKIIGWIIQNMKKDDTLNPDRLKRQVMKYIAHALREINDKNSHQIKLSRSQLTDVVSYAMKDINREIDQLKHPYKISFFITILGYILNFVAESYYTVKRIPAAFKMSFFSWFGKRTAGQSKVAQKHADDVYIKILSKTSYKGIIQNMSSALELKNWITRKSEGIEPHIRENIDSFVTKEVFDEFKIHQKNFLEPLLIKLVVDAKKAKVADALASFPHLVSLIKANMNLDFEVSDSRFKATTLAILNQIPGLEDLVIEDIVNYPQEMKRIQTVLTDNPEQLLIDNPHFQNELSIAFGNYLKGDFIKHLSSFVTYPNAKRVEQILVIGNNAQEFTQHCVTKILNKEMDSSPEMIFTELSTYFKIEGCNTLDKEANNLVKEFNKLHTVISDNLIQSLDEQYVTRLTTIIQHQLLPVLVNMYPLEVRSKLLLDASDSKKIKQLLTDHGMDLLKLMDSNQEMVPDFIFTKLTSSRLPAQINLNKEIDDAEKSIKIKIDDMMKRSVPDLLLGKLFTPSSWSLTKEHLYDTAMVELLKSNDFLNSISIMLPYNQWLKLKILMQKDYQAVLSIARVIIDKVASGKSSQLNPEELVDLINKQMTTDFVLADKAGNDAARSLKNISDEIRANPIASLNPQLKTRFTHLASSQMLPLLSGFINEDENKQQFLAMNRSDETLINFVTKNSNTLNSLETQTDDELRVTVLSLINQLVPESSKLVLADIIDAQGKALASSKLVLKEVQKIALTTFLNSALFYGLMEDFLNQEDFRLFQRYISSPEQRSLLADKMIEQGIDSLNKQSILDIIRSSDASLKLLSPMDDRFNSIKEFFKASLANAELILDQSKVQEYIADEISPILFHEQFINVIDETIGFLDKQDLIVLFEAMIKANPAVRAKQLIEFINTIRGQDKEYLINHFLTDQSLIKDMLVDIKELIEEVLDCHCYYNNHNRKGSQGWGVSPKIINKVSVELREIKISSSYSFFGEFSRKLFYIKGIQSGIAAGGEISADSNKHIIKELERVNSHILRPLWWSTNVWNISHSLIKASRNVVHAVVAAYFFVLNGFKLVLNDMNGNDFTVSTKNPDSRDYNDTAFDYSLEINELSPLNADQVKDPDCNPDVVIKLEEFVAKRKTRPGFFRDIRDCAKTDAQATLTIQP